METQKAPKEVLDLRITQLLKDTQDDSGRSLFEHFCDFYYEMQYEPKTKCSEQMKYFEMLSQFLKKHSFRYAAPKTSEEVNNFKDELFSFQEYVKSLKSLYETQPTKLNTIIPSFPFDNSLLQNAGIGFTQEEAWQLQQSLKRLVNSQPPGYFYSLRFWGKILTNSKDYYVVESLLERHNQEDLPNDSESAGTGVNEYVHYVTNDIYDEWCLLPCVSKSQIEVSRQIKYTFSGNLNKTLNTYPVFLGKEKHLLKAQIIRITHSNLIAPRGLYKPNDDKPKIIEFDEEFKIPELAELSTLESWVHVPPNILKLGRITHYADPSLSEEQRNTILEELAEKDPDLDRLKSIAEDKAVEPYEFGWLVKTTGETQQFIGLDDVTNNYSLVIFKNYLWPGAVTVCDKNTWTSIYIGYGQKNVQSPFVPISPNDLQEEPDDNDEFPEPNPQTLADELEPDSDDERRKAQEQLEAEQNANQDA